MGALVAAGERRSTRARSRRFGSSSQHVARPSFVLAGSSGLRPFDLPPAGTVGLIAAGMASTTAVGAVILYQLASCWSPLLPDWAALVVLRRSGDL